MQNLCQFLLSQCEDFTLFLMYDGKYLVNCSKAKGKKKYLSLLTAIFLCWYYVEKTADRLVMKIIVRLSVMKIKVAY